jgi:hypothetical protein
MHEEWTDRFSAYLDGEATATEGAAIEAHLVECTECRRVMEELRAVTAWAPAYAGIEPSPEVWARIADGVDRAKSAQLGVASPRRYSLGQLAAAAAIVAVVSASSVWLALRPATQVSPTGTEPVAALVAAGAPEDEAWDDAVRELEAVVASGGTGLDSATVRILEENLRIIDAAIADARAAIAADPSNMFLGGRVKTHMQRKLVLLRQAARVAGAAS